jgi:uncharacterized protein
MNVAVIGASEKENRYSYKAIKMLMENGHNVFPVHPTLKSVLGLNVYSSIKEIDKKIDTVTLYVNNEISEKISADIISSKPARIIFNPGTENEPLKKIFEKAGIQVLEACTLILLGTNRF